MADQYESVDGWNNAGTLAAITPQPRSTGIDYEDRTKASSGMIFSRGHASTELVYDVLSPSELAAVMTSLGVSEVAPSNQVTIRVLVNAGTWANFNAIVVMRNKRRDGPFWKNVSFDVTYMEAL